jgi:hypothetical protein
MLLLYFRSPILSSLQTLSVSYCVALTQSFLTTIVPVLTQLKQLEMRGVFRTLDFTAQKTTVRERLDLAIFEHEEQLKYSSTQVNTHKSVIFVSASNDLPFFVRN